MYAEALCVFDISQTRRVRKKEGKKSSEIKFSKAEPENLPNEGTLRWREKNKPVRWERRTAEIQHGSLLLDRDHMKEATVLRYFLQVWSKEGEWKRLEEGLYGGVCCCSLVDVNSTCRLKRERKRKPTRASEKLAARPERYLGCCWRRCLERHEVKKTEKDQRKGHISPSVQVFRSGRSLASPFSTIASFLAKLLAPHTLPKLSDESLGIAHFFFSTSISWRVTASLWKEEAKLERRSDTIQLSDWQKP